MNRYFFYSILMVMIVNIMVYVPNILLSQRYEGGLMGAVVSIPISTLLLHVFSKSMMLFPGKGLPEIFEEFLPKWLRLGILFFLATMWYISGVIVLVTFSVLTKRFINPDMSLVAILFLFSIITCSSAVRPTRTVLYVLEIVMIMSVPFILFVISKALVNKYLMWDAIWSMKNYVWKLPTWSSISASTYIFIGYINMSIFNRVFEGKFNTKFFWAIPILGLFNLFTSLAIPIGYHGTVAVEDYPFPWVVTADSLRMELAFIERVLFPFLLLYINVSVLFAIVTWHVAIEMYKSVFPIMNSRSKWKPVIYSIKFAVFMTPPLIFIRWYDQPTMFLITKAWLNLRLISEIFLVGLLFFLSRRRRTGS